MFWRQNTTPVFNKDSDRYQAMPKYSMRGVPDIIVIKNKEFIGLEVKRPGEKQSKHQVEFQSKCEAVGGKYYVVESLDDVIAIGL